MLITAERQNAGAARNTFRWYERRMSALRTGIMVCKLFIFSCLVAVIAARWIEFSFTLSLCLAFIFSSVVLLFLRPWDLDSGDFLKKAELAFPQAEYSLHLLQKGQDVTVLEALQVSRLDSIFPEILKKIKPWYLERDFILVFSGTCACLVLSVLLFVWPFPLSPAGANHKILPHASNFSVHKTSDRKSQIIEGHLTIFPPSYTHLKNRTQDSFNAVVPQGTKLVWTFSSNGRKRLIAGEGSYAFNPKSGLVLTAMRSMSYQIEINKRILGPYNIEVKLDSAPQIVILRGAGMHTFNWKQAKNLLLAFKITDDYAIGAASLILTTASGSGEAVKFKKADSIILSKPANASRSLVYSRTIDLAGYKMAPSDELYGFVMASDHAGHESRSETFMVRIADTSTTAAGLKAGSANEIKPVFFRSQRQIIIETEALLKDQRRLSKPEFRERSNELGEDQKLLRLRYGKFLGEENENEVGEGSSVKPGFGDEKATMDLYTDKHDNAEDNSFLDPDSRRQLKAILAPMWQSELMLRTARSYEALPFEYTALRLLKHFQEGSRVYLKKSGSSLKDVQVKENRLKGSQVGIESHLEMGSYSKTDTTAFLNRLMHLISVNSTRKDEPLTPTEDRDLSRFSSLLQISGQKETALLRLASTIQKWKMGLGKPNAKAIHALSNEIRRRMDLTGQSQPIGDRAFHSKVADQYFKLLDRR